MKTEGTSGIFEEAVRNRLYRFAATLLGDRAEAEDAVHDVLERLWKRRDSISGVRNIESFALTSVRNNCIDKIRHRRETTDQIPDRESPDRSDSWSDVEKVRNAIRQLPDRQREIIHLRDIEGYTSQETAKIIGIDEAQVRVYLSRARKAVRTIIENEDNYGIQH